MTVCLMPSRSAARLSALLYNTHSHTHTHTHSCLWPTSSRLYAYICVLTLITLPARGTWIMGSMLLLLWPRLTLSLLFALLSSFILAESKHNPIFFVLFSLFVLCRYLYDRLWKNFKSSHLYLYSAFNNTNCNKALHNIKIGKFCQ